MVDKLDRHLKGLTLKGLNRTATDKKEGAMHHMDLNLQISLILRKIFTPSQKRRLKYTFQAN